MQDLPSISPTEALFAERAVGLLPLDQARTYRSESGALVYQWEAPCEEVKGLWLTIYDQQEIMLSSQLSHTHVERWQIARNVTEDDDIWRALIDQGIAQARDILNGETVFIKYCDEHGKEVSSSEMSPRWLWKNPKERAKWTKFRGEGWTARAWDWRGEVTDI